MAMFAAFFASLGPDLQGATAVATDVSDENQYIRVLIIHTWGTSNIIQKSPL